MSNEPSVPFAYNVTYAQHVAQLGFFLTIIFCFFLIYLTVFRVKRNFGSYKHFLIIFPCFGIIFATLEFILYPNIFSHNAGYFFYTTSRPFQVSKTVIYYLLSIYTGIYAFTISMLSVQFLYRYWAIFSTPKLIYFKGWKFWAWIVYSSFFPLQWALGLIYFDEIDEYSKNYVVIPVMEKLKIDLSEIVGLALVAYDMDGSIRWRNICCTINMTTVMLIQYTVIIYCATRMYLDMEAELQLVSASLKNLHRQFFKTLILQIVTPSVTLFAPVLFIIYLPFLDLELELPTGIFLCALSLYPAMDAAIVLYIVKDYRSAAKLVLSQLSGTRQK